ncbi:putative repeat protein (TIGR01451 family) [Tahibacter aquaticus]|uniref:Putative repeat protein (TIGR01451 family) n=1 Tax=Tahibacter aquaticus TaxID=520092 RepID=A0A4R6Z2T9_9GAMM|nr:DUF11 domain-containing protein [Tahibacter aquaticus]TDR45925.1 putative repeat protein (TIGR01451 family) [Tahibacter aquaticus]
MNRKAIALVTALACTGAGAAEVTVKNDSLGDFDPGAIVWGFAPGEAAASWLTSPCNGNLRAVQVFWRSPNANSAVEIHDSITVFRGGTFPNPGAEAAVIGGPVLNDGVINQWRFLDENNTIPLNVPLSNGEVFVISFKFFTEPLAGSGPSVVRDADGIQSNRNALLADFGGTFVWFNSATLGLTGDWVIRGVVDCPVVVQNADVAVNLSASLPLYSPGAPLDYTVTVSNAGPVAAANTSIVDIFPAGYTATSWTCSASGGASCTSGGSGNITQNVSLPSGSQVIYQVSGTVDAGTTGSLSNAATAVVGGSVTDPSPSNNTMSLLLLPESDRLFKDTFEPVN